MSAWRALIGSHRRLALLVLTLAFAVRALVPAGYMVAASDTTVLTVSVCADSTGGLETVHLTIPVKAGDQERKAGGNDGACAFSAIGKSALGGADPVLLALAFAFLVVLGLAPARRAPVSPPPYLLPPLRGPPAAA